MACEVLHDCADAFHCVTVSSFVFFRICDCTHLYLNQCIIAIKGGLDDDTIVYEAGLKTD